MIKYFLALLLAVVAYSEGSVQPHIVFILADDIGWNDFSFHGSDQIQTPNIDALAYNGVILHQHYVQPICTPTRSALMTGRYPSNIGMQGWPIAASEPRALPEGKLLPQYLKDLGYSTHIIGKWHLGYFKQEFTPTRRGFDSFLGYYNGYISYYDHIIEQVLSNESSLYGIDFRRNSSEALDLSGKYATDVFTVEAERIIREHDPSSPLFLYVAHLAAHAGNRGKLVEAPQEAIDKFPHIIEPNRKTYAGMIWKLDESVGRIVKALQEAGMLENSIIVFMSDNGAPTNDYNYQNWGSNYPFRGVKGTQWEGGVRNPAVVWSPLLPRHVSEELMHVTDWLPTLHSAAGGEALTENLDGVDQWLQLLHRGRSQRSHALLEFDEIEQIYALRDGNWKITQGSVASGTQDGYYGDDGKTSDNPPYNVTAVLNSDVGKSLSQISRRVSQREEDVLEIRDEVTVTCPQQGNPTPCKAAQGVLCLFNLTADPCETNNLADVYPDEVQRMLQLLDGYWTTMVNQTSEPTDLNSDPKNFNNFWSPWVSS